MHINRTGISFKIETPYKCYQFVPRQGKIAIVNQSFKQRKFFRLKNNFLAVFIYTLAVKVHTNIVKWKRVASTFGSPQHGFNTRNKFQNFKWLDNIIISAEL